MTEPTPIRDTSAQDRPLPGPTPAAKRRRRLAVGLAVVLLVAVTVPALQGLSTAGRSVSLARLTLAEVERGVFVRDLAAEGRVVAAVSPTLYAPQAGLARLKVKAGDSVKRGDVLASIDSPELLARLAQERSSADTLQAEHQRAIVDARQQRATLEGAHENARIDHATAANNLTRQRKAFDAGAVAGMQVDQARDALDKAVIALRQAAAALELKEDSLRLDVQARALAHQRQLLRVQELERQVAELQVRSPIDGQVGQVLIGERASVAANAPLLSVVDLSALEVQMQVGESFARELGVGMPGEIGVSGRPWPAVVSAISPEVVNNEVAARLRFAGQTPPQLRQSQRLSVRVLLDRRDGVLTVRRGSFVDESGGTHAYVLRDGQAQRVPIRVGARGLDKVEILDGLAAGDQVVISGAEAFGGAPAVALSR